MSSACRVISRHGGNTQSGPDVWREQRDFCFLVPPVASLNWTSAFRNLAGHSMRHLQGCGMSPERANCQTLWALDTPPDNRTDHTGMRHTPTSGTYRLTYTRVET
jgi:hypothetical protein